MFRNIFSPFLHDIDQLKKKKKKKKRNSQYHPKYRYLWNIDTVDIFWHSQNRQTSCFENSNGLESLLRSKTDANCSFCSLILERQEADIKNNNKSILTRYLLFWLFVELEPSGDSFKFENRLRGMWQLFFFSDTRGRSKNYLIREGGGVGWGEGEKKTLSTENVENFPHQVLKMLKIFHTKYWKCWKLSTGRAPKIMEILNPKLGVPELVLTSSVGACKLP